MRKENRFDPFSLEHKKSSLNDYAIAKCKAVTTAYGSVTEPVPKFEWEKKKKAWQRFGWAKIHRQQSGGEPGGQRMIWFTIYCSDLEAGNEGLLRRRFERNRVSWLFRVMTGST